LGIILTLEIINFVKNNRQCFAYRPDRTFRFEERDQYGVVHGRYGYYDQTGKFRIVNYSAHPEHGFKAEGDFGPK